LQRLGLIEYSRGRIVVLDRVGVEMHACECYQVVKKEYERLLPRGLRQLKTWIYNNRERLRAAAHIRALDNMSANVPQVQAQLTTISDRFAIEKMRAANALPTMG
jgi:uncharacterized phage-like protein YoqJ